MEQKEQGSVQRVDGSSAGEIDQIQQVAGNTIVTSDKGDVESRFYEEGQDEPACGVTSTEPHHRFDTITNRWMPMKVLSILQSHKQGEIVKTYMLPLDLITTDACASNSLAFRQFIYGRFDIELLFKVNANRFQCGRVCAYITPDSCNYTEPADALYRGVQRQHIMLDLCGSNQGRLVVPWTFHRPMIRTSGSAIKNAGVASGRYASVSIAVLSPLSVVTGQSTSVQVVPMFRFRKALFTGMSYAADPVVTAQMLSLPKIWKIAEIGMDTIGRLKNMDKPTVLAERALYSPKPRLNFTQGKGVSFAEPLKLDPTSLTTYGPDQQRLCGDDSILSLMRIWGFIKNFEWSAAAVEEKTLWTTKISPTNMANPENSAQYWSPLEYIMNNFMYWRGTIEFRFDFASTSFHTGTVMICAEYGRTGITNFCQASSSYVKYYDLGDQKTVTFVIPYIYDTVWRRTQNVPFTAFAREQKMSLHNSGVIPTVLSSVSMRVVNGLRAPASVVQKVDVLVFVRAGEDYHAHGLCQSNLILDGIPTAGIKQFPYEFINSSRTARSTTVRALTELAMGISDLASSQMDTEFVENADQTKTFNKGIIRPYLQTSESQMSIKDILRRPLLVMTDRTVKAHIEDKARPSGFFIPCMPPTSCYTRYNDETGWEGSVRASPQSMLLNLFRFWRGSLRFTIVVKKWTAPPLRIYIYHVPKSGITVFGNATKPYATDETTSWYKKFSLGMTGIACDILCPSVNTTTEIEVPFTTEVDWCTMHNGDQTSGVNSQLPWRDRSDENIGHLVVESPAEIEIDVWISAGDDFEVAGWLGCPKGKRNIRNTVPTDDRTVYNQMFPVMSVVSGALEKGASWVCEKAPAIAGSAAKAAPVAVCAGLVGSAVSISKSVKSMSQEVHRAVDSAECMTAQLIGNVEDKMVAPSVELLQHLSAIFAPYSGGINVNNLVVILMEIFEAWVASSWEVVSRCFIKILLLSNLVGVNSIAALTASLTQTIIYNTSVAPQSDNFGFNFSALLITAIATFVGVTIDPRTTSVARSFTLNFLTSKSFTMVTHLTRFLKETYDEVKWAVYKVCGYSDPQVEIMQILSEKSEFLKTFVTDAQKYLMECNKNSVIRDPTHKSLFWVTVCNAMQIQQMLIRCPEKKVSPILASLCREIINKANEEHIMLANCPVRYEPFVICMEGESGIGKSFITSSIAVELVKNAGISDWTGEVVYVKNPGPAYWNGYRNQPVINFDEWLNIGNPQYMAEQIADLYNLKSTAIFNPNMAALSEKEIRGNPYAVIINTNNAYPPLSEMPNREAILRRRDEVVSVRIKEQYKDINVRDIDRQVLDVFGHLEFAFHTSKQEYSAKDYMEYSEFLEILLVKHSTYHRTEKKNVKARIHKFAEVMGNTCHLSEQIEDPFLLYYKSAVTMDLDPTVPNQSALPSDLLEYKAQQIVEHLRNYREEEEVEAQAPELPANFESALTAILEMKTLCKGMCEVCKEEKVVGYECVNSREGAEHVVCYQCHRGIVRANYANRNVCPLCRGHLQEMQWGKPQGCVSSFISKLGRLAKKVLMFGATEWKLASSWLEVCLNYYDIQTGLMALLLLTCPWQMTTLRVTGNWVLATMFGGLCLVTGTSVTSLFDDTLDTMGTLLIDRMNVVPIAARYSPALAQSEEMQPVEDCPHTPFLANHCYFLLEDGEEIICQVYNTVEVQKLPFKSCGPTCWVGDEARVRDFLNRWRAFNRFSVENILRSNIPSVTFHIPYMIWQPPKSTVQQLIDTFKNAWQDYLITPLKKLWEIIVNNIGKIVGVTVSVASVIGLYFVYRQRQEPAVEEQSPSNGAGPQAGGMIRSMRGAIWRIAAMAEAQSQATTETCVNKIVSNMGQIVVKGDKNAEVWLVFTGWYGKYALLHEHYLSALADYTRKGYKLFLRPMNQPDVLIPWTYQAYAFRPTRASDIMVFKLPPQYPIFSDLRKKIATVEDVTTKCIMRDCWMVEAPDIAGVKQVQVRTVNVSSVLPRKEVMGYNGKTYVIHDVLKYNYSRKGACGSFILSPNLDRPIVAVHSAGVGIGDKGDGYAVCLFSDFFDEWSDIADPNSVDEWHVDWTDKGKIVLDPAQKGNMMEIGSVRRGVFIPSKTKIQLSDIADLLPKPKSMIVCLNSQDPRWKRLESPLAAAINEQGEILGHIDDTLVQITTSWLQSWFVKCKSRRANVGVLTYKQAIQGFDGLEYYDSIDMKTSAGWPWCQRAKRTNKIPWIVDGEPVAQLRTEIERKIGLWSQGIKTNVVFMDVLKDERRSKLNPRLISAAPVDYVIAVRMYVLDFLAAVMNHKISNFVGVGMNPDGEDWTYLYTKLREKNESRIVAFDYKSFGHTLSSQLVQAFVEVVVFWYQAHSDYNEAQLRTLATMLLENQNSYHIVVDLIYQLANGSPSGSPVTVIVNSIVNLGYLFLAWQHLVDDSFENFLTNVYPIVYGDDGGLAVTPEYLPIYNGTTIQGCLSLYGITMTGPNKEAVVPESYEYDNFTFLKRGFRPHPRRPGKWLAPVKWDSVEDCAKFIRGKEHTGDLTMVNANMSVLLSYGHGPEKYEEWRKKINICLGKKGLPTINKLWDQLDREVFDEGRPLGVDILLDF